MDDYNKIKIGLNATGIIGLKTVLAELDEKGATLAEDQVGSFMRDKLAQKNYIPATAKDLYEQAFLREYKKHIGEPIADEVPGELRIRVLGPGCPRCEKLERDIRHILAQNSLAADLEYTNDPLEIANYGALALPILIINDKVVSTGITPSKAKLEAWIFELQ